MTLVDPYSKLLLIDWPQGKREFCFPETLNVEVEGKQNSRFPCGQAWVVQKVGNAIHRINHYPVDSVVCLVNIYPLDSDLSGG